MTSVRMLVTLIVFGIAFALSIPQHGQSRSDTIDNDAELDGS